MSTSEHPIWRLWQRLERGEALVAGVLSGTSADGIDVALLCFGVAGTPRPLAFATRPFPTILAEKLRAALDGGALDARGVAFLNRDLGRAFGSAARALADEHGLVLDLVGSHGQTVYHHDGNEAAGAASLQLGDGDFVAQASGALTVSDFRAADIAAGGEGAPISATLEAELFPAVPRPVAVLNLGGFANVTYLAEGCPPVAFDIGPANALLDGLARALLARPFDEGGRAAAHGRVDQALLAELLSHPFYDRRPPKSTGRDTFGASFASSVLARARARNLDALDTLATATALVAASVAEALARWLPGRPLELVLCGGGTHNATLARELADRTGLLTRSSAVHGLTPEARESTFFAHLAVRCILARPTTEPSVTGARCGGILGKISYPPSSVPSSQAFDSPGLARSHGANPG